MLSRVCLFTTLWTIARQAPLSMGFPRQEFWSGLPFPSSWILPDPGIKPVSPALQADSFTTEPPRKPPKLLLLLLLSHIRRQPLRLPRPWDSPGKNAGVGCHFLLQ